MKLALAQMEVVPGQPKKNLETMLRMINDAKAQHVDLIAFPELCVGGYLLGDKFLDDAYCEDLMEYNEIIRQASEGIAIAYGNIFVDKDIDERTQQGEYHPNKDGRTRKYNAVYVFQNGRPAERGTFENRFMGVTKYVLPPGVQPKSLLPNYRFFDDERYFFSIEDIAKDFDVSMESITHPLIINADGKEVPIGFEVCEDLWCEDYRRDGKAQNPTKMLINNGAEFIVNISASPWTYGKNGARDRRIKFLKEESGSEFVPFFYVNCTGAQNNGKNIVTFDGGSTVYNTNADAVGMSKVPYAEELVVMDTDTIPSLPILVRQEKSMIAQKYDALITGIRHMKDLQGRKEQPKYVIGMSGGVDSSVVAALLVKAVGRDKVLGVNMPTKFNSDKTKLAASYVAEKLGIPYLEIPIGDLATLNETLLEQYDFTGMKKGLNPLQRGNVAAKIRGTSILSNIAAKYGALFPNNGNKLETALGYATLYGDVNGALALLGDLSKVEVFALAKYLNEEVFHEEIIPPILLPDELCRFTSEQIQPSAELEENQIDPMKFGYHDAVLTAMTDYKKKSAGDIMGWYLEGTMEKNLGVSTAMLERWNMTNPQEFVKDLEWFTQQSNWAVFKRVQAPPIIITSKSAYGYDIRESILPYAPTREEERRKETILKMERYVSSEVAI